MNEAGGTDGHIIGQGRAGNRGQPGGSARGWALSLGEAGATVYITGRSVHEGDSGVPLPGSITQTAAEVSTIGGAGIAIQCDHRDDAQVAAVFQRIMDEQGRLDVLVNNAWAGYEGYADNRHPPPNAPFWNKPIDYWDENLAGLRWAYVASCHAAPIMTGQRVGADRQHQLPRARKVATRPTTSPRRGRIGWHRRWRRNYANTMWPRCRCRRDWCGRSRC